MSVGQRRKVLFVDDAPDEADLYAEYFDRESDIVPVTALSADEALSRLDGSDVDCLVSDSVHTTDGEPLVAAAKRAHPDLPVLLYSGGSPAELPTDVVDGHLTKGERSDTSTALETLHERIRDLTPVPDREQHAAAARNAAPAAGTGSGPGSEWRPAGRADPDRDGAWRPLGTFDWNERESPAATVVDALAERTAFDPVEWPPLFDTVDPDGVDSLMTHSTATGPTPEVRVTFVVGGHAVRMSSDGAVDYRERRADR